MFFISTIHGEVEFIVCGSEPGEIFFTAVHPRWSGYRGFYYSSDMGAHIELRDSSNCDYGSLIADAADQTLHCVRFYPSPAERVSFDGGFSWTEVNQVLTRAYASGVISGEIYRMVENNSHILERSVNNGVQYTPCLGSGFPDSTFIYSAALGVDSGEVYIWSGHGYLYYSVDYGEHFAFHGDLYAIWGIYPNSFIINGAEPGEIYAFIYDPKVIWRITDYGNNAELIADFPPVYNFWRASIASSAQPGELFFLAIYWDGGPGGTIHIYHTTNYGQDWTLYEHIMQPESVQNPNHTNLPASISLNVYPNPTNSTLHISYDLPSGQTVQLKMVDILGQVVWQHNAGFQFSGYHQVTTTQDNLSSGRYTLLLQTGTERITRQIAFVK